MPTPPRREPNQARRFSWFLWICALPPLAFGIWGVCQGIIVQSWPRAPAVITRNEMSIHTSQSHSDTGRTQRNEFASVDLEYRYTVAGRNYFGSQVEVAALELQNSAVARNVHEKYPVGTETEVAFDPDNPEVAYLKPGPGSVALVATGIGAALILVGAWARWASRQKDRLAEQGIDDEDE